jgi:uroporphyrinogen-III synthase
LRDTSASSSLIGLKVLVTRPAHQAEFFCRSVEQSGGIAIRFPTIAISPKESPSPAPNPLNSLNSFDYAIFISANAVEQTFKRLNKNEFPTSLQCAAVGKKTAQALKHHGLPIAITPKTNYTSEALLAHPNMQSMQNKNVLIVRGEGGRELLAETLRKRGAIVKYSEVYRRCLPEYTDEKIGMIIKDGTVSVITITSAESLNNLVTLFSRIDGNRLHNLPLILGSNRILETARQLGFKQSLVVANNPSDEAMLQALLEWAKTTEAKTRKKLKTPLQ